MTCSQPSGSESIFSPAIVTACIPIEGGCVNLVNFRNFLSLVSCLLLTESYKFSLLLESLCFFTLIYLLCSGCVLTIERLCWGGGATGATACMWMLEDSSQSSVLFFYQVSHTYQTLIIRCGNTLPIELPHCCTS